MSTAFQITFDASDPQALAQFWVLALGYSEQPPPDGFDSWEDFARQAGIPEEQWGDYGAAVDPDGWGPRLFFQKVPEAKSAKNRVHLDINIGGGGQTPLHERKERIAEHVERLMAAGATQRDTFERSNDYGTEYWVVMQDPEGNEFCVQ